MPRASTFRLPTSAPPWWRTARSSQLFPAKLFEFREREEVRGLLLSQNAKGRVLFCHLLQAKHDIPSEPAVHLGTPRPQRLRQDGIQILARPAGGAAGGGRVFKTVGVIKGSANFPPVTCLNHSPGRP